jgi:hypothetical protein
MKRVEYTLFIGASAALMLGSSACGSSKDDSSVQGAAVRPSDLPAIGTQVCLAVHFDKKQPYQPTEMPAGFDFAPAGGPSGRQNFGANVRVYDPDQGTPGNAPSSPGTCGIPRGYAVDVNTTAASCFGGTDPCEQRSWELKNAAGDRLPNINRDVTLGYKPRLAPNMFRWAPPFADDEIASITLGSFTAYKTDASPIPPPSVPPPDPWDPANKGPDGFYGLSGVFQWAFNYGVDGSPFQNSMMDDLNTILATDATWNALPLNFNAYPAANKMPCPANTSPCLSLLNIPAPPQSNIPGTGAEVQYCDDDSRPGPPLQTPYRTCPTKQQWATYIVMELRRVTRLMGRYYSGKCALFTVGDGGTLLGGNPNRNAIIGAPPGARTAATATAVMATAVMAARSPAPGARPTIEPPTAAARWSTTAAPSTTRRRAPRRPAVNTARAAEGQTATRRRRRTTAGTSAARASASTCRRTRASRRGRSSRRG